MRRKSVTSFRKKYLNKKKTKKIDKEVILLKHFKNEKSYRSLSKKKNKQTKIVFFYNSNNFRVTDLFF